MVIGRRRFRLAVLAVAGVLVLASCSGGDDGSDAVDSSAAVVTLLPSEDPVEADVPAEYLDAVLADVAARSGLAAADLTVLDSTAVEWGDQRLGCIHSPAPSQPEPVDGYRVMVDTGSSQFDYRLDAAGIPHLCGEPITTGGGEGHEDDHGDDEHGDEEAPEESSS